MKKRFGDRKDGVKVRNINGLNNIMVDIKPKRCDSDVYINEKIDVTELVKYIKKLKKKDDDFTFFHAFITAIAKTIYHRPLLNRFVVRNTFYQRNDVVVSFVAKVTKEDDAKEFLSVQKINPENNIFGIKKEIVNKVKYIRENNMNATDNLVDKVGRLPKIIRRFVVWIYKKLDVFDLLPKSITDTDLYHSSVIISNLGSIDCGAIYHNLTNFGTNSIILTIGKIKKEPRVNEKGEIVVRDICEFGINLDERLSDGVYMAKSVRLFSYILEHPELLEEKINEAIK